MLYRIRHQGHTAYLFGTVHVGTAAFYPLDNEVTTALTQAGKLVLEIDIRNTELFQAALRKHGMYANGGTLEQHVSPVTLAQVHAALQEAGIPYQTVRSMKPWLLANMLIGLDLERHGYQRTHGIESFLLTVADRQTMKVQELESAEYQMSLFDDMSDADQEQYLRENLAEIGDGNALKKAQTLIDAWASANDHAMQSFWRESLKEKSTSSEFTRRVLIDKRNPEMAGKIENLLKNDASIFVGVGLLHLIGDQGVPSLLKQRGYEVERLY